MPFGWTIPSTVFPRKAKMSSRGIANVVRVSMTFSLFQASQKEFLFSFLFVDRRGVVPSTGEDQPRSSTHSPH